MPPPPLSQSDRSIQPVEDGPCPLKEFADALPDYAKDLRLNLGSLLSDQTLGEQRKYGLLLACAHGTGYRPMVAAAEAEVEGSSARGGQCRPRRRGGDGDEQCLLPLRPPRLEPGYATLPAKLRMNFIGSPGHREGRFRAVQPAVRR